MTNPSNAVGTNAAYGTRTSVNAFGDVLQVFAGRGVVSGWAVVPSSGMTVEVGGIAGTRDVAVAEDNLGNRTCINNRSGSPIEITLGAASVSTNRYSAIVVYCNNPAIAADTTPDAPDVCGILEVEGGTTGVSEAQIRTAISADGGTGTTAYYAVLAVIYIAAGTTTITGSNITMPKGGVNKIDAGSFSYMEGSWEVCILPNGKRMWCQNGVSTSDEFPAGMSNWGYATDIAELPASVDSIDDVYVCGFASALGGSASTKLEIANGTLVGGARKFGVGITEYYGTGNITLDVRWSIILYEK